MMNILLAPNSMKGSVDAFAFADIMETAFQEVSDQFSIRKVPVADGGDMTGEILIRALNMEYKNVMVSDPLGRKVEATYGIKEGLAIIETANAVGMKLLNKEELNPLKATSFGAGQLFLDAVTNGANEIWIGLGGSATVDAGMGLLEALGVCFFDQNNELLKGCGANLSRIKEIDTSGIRIKNNIRINIICDVDNPLIGQEGAAHVFAPQKGATSAMVDELENGILNFSNIVQEKTGLNLNLLPGAGAAGGMPIALIAFLKAEIVKGSEFILDNLNFEEHLNWADIVVTGEGKLDGQTLKNKAPYAVAFSAKNKKKPVYAVVGIMEGEKPNLFEQVFPMINNSVDIEYSINNARKLISQRTKEMAKMLICSE